MGNESTRWKPGQSGNPKGRPKGIDIVKIIKDKLEEVPEGEERCRGEQLADVIIDQMLVDKDVRTIEDTLDRLYGKPLQTLHNINENLPEVVEIDLSDVETDSGDASAMEE